MKRLEVLPAGERIGRYEVVDLLGEGGMAAVYRVRHRQLRSVHALKVVAVPSRAVMARLLQEGRAQASVRHRNIVAVHDVIEVDGSPGLVMEYVEGPTLEGLLAAGPLALPLADALGRGLLAGIAAAHRAGVVHRDLKPANVLLAIEDRELVPKIGDFGIARELGDDGVRRTRMGAFMGTPSYMAPEQMRDARSVDHRADLWAAGTVLHELLTGRRLFDGDDLLEVCNAVARGEYRPVRDLRPDAEDRMADAIARAIVLDPEGRVGSAEAMAEIWSRGVPDAELAPRARLDPDSEARIRALIPPPPAPAAPSTSPAQTVEVPAGRPRWALLGTAFVAGLAGTVVCAALAMPWQVGTPPDPAPVAADTVAPEPVADLPRPPPVETPVAAPAAVVPRAARVAKAPDASPPSSPASPRPSAPSPPPAPPPDPAPVAHATVVQRGDPGVRVLLEQDDGISRIPGDVPSGHYTVFATFEGDVVPTRVMTLDLTTGQVTALVCRQSFRRCNRE